jgi:hypothetical protein
LFLVEAHLDQGFSFIALLLDRLGGMFIDAMWLFRATALG